MVDTRVELCGLSLDNPVIPASGTFGFGYEFAEWYDINILGSIALKGTTAEPRFGNPTPRIAECTAGLINSVGLQNPGVDAVISTELPKLKKVFHKPAIANVSGFSAEEYETVCARLDGQDEIGMLEVNISCPNVHCGGMAFGTRGGGRNHPPGEGGHQEAGYDKAVAQCDRYRVDRFGLRGGRRRRDLPDQHPAWDAD